MEQYKDRDWLHKMYWGRGLSAGDIGKICGTTKQSILYWMRKINLSRRERIEAYRKNPHRKYSHNKNIFKEIDTPEKAYWLGFIAADGSVATKKKRLTILLNHKDRGHLEKFKKFLDANNPIQTKQYSSNKNPYSFIGICSWEIVRDLEKYNIVPNKTFRLKFPNIPKKYYPDFIRGYFDGDGSLFRCKKERRKNDLVFSICSGTKSFLEKIQQILIENCKLGKTKIARHDLRYCGNLQVPRILNYLLKNSDIKLERKYKLLTEI